MSDRLAVFNDGPDRAGRRAGRGLRAPGAASSSPASWASRTSLERDGRRFTIRPEKVRILHDATRGRAARRGAARSATSPTSAWSPATWSTSTRGGELQVVRQNLEMSSQEALEQQGRRVRSAGASEHTYAIPDAGTTRGGTREVREMDRAGRGHGAVAGRGGRLRRRDCGELVDGSGGGQGARGAEGTRRSSARARARSNLIAWAGYVEDGSTDPKVDWVSDFEKETGCQVNVEDRQHVGRDGHADAHRAVRRRVGIRRRDAAPDRGRRRRPGQHRPGPELQGRVRRASRTSRATRVDGVALRHPARPRREPADVQQGRRQAGAGLVGRGVRRRTRPTRARSRPTTTRSTSPTRRCT